MVVAVYACWWKCASIIETVSLIDNSLIAINAFQWHGTGIVET